MFSFSFLSSYIPIFHLVSCLHSFECKARAKTAFCIIIVIVVEVKVTLVFHIWLSKHFWFPINDKIEYSRLLKFVIEIFVTQK